ncbi:MAG TPA: LytTR family DNA-binding domain-containing protein [Flavisolibacter sp.]|nr:LytTR family DNA-binding domain-containing protein [Flavisolibacter sp.]
MTSAIIIDDEANNISNLQSLLQQHCPQVQVVATATAADDGELKIQQYRPELVFLDIQMPGKSGFDLLQSLKQRSFEVIFVTAYDQYGIQAVKFSAIDYLLKPINVEELKSAVWKAIARSTEKKQNHQLENLIHLLQQKQEKTLHRIALPSARETRFIETEKILRCESSNNYTSFFLIDGEKIVASRPIFEYEELLKEYGFFRCHQSHLINTRYIKSWVKEEGGYLLMEDGSQVPVSRYRKEALRALLK